MGMCNLICSFTCDFHHGLFTHLVLVIKGELCANVTFLSGAIPPCAKPIQGLKVEGVPDTMIFNNDLDNDLCFMQLCATCHVFYHFLVLTVHIA